MYTVRSTFLTREGQFEKGRQSQAVGILQAAISKTSNLFEFQVKNDPKKVYFRQGKELWFDVKKTNWINNQGKPMFIFPLSAFNQRQLKDNSLF